MVTLGTMIGVVLGWTLVFGAICYVVHKIAVGNLETKLFIADITEREAKSRAAVAENKIDEWRRRFVCFDPKGEVAYLPSGWKTDYAVKKP